jgi:DNA-binding transcriptional regulator LsrR (DeoR family)
LKFTDIQIVPLAGSFGASFDTLPNYNVIQLADLTGGKSHLLHFPAFCSSKEEYETLSSNSKVQSTLNRADIFKASKHARVSIGIAEGIYKKDIIHSALSLHLINSFFTTKETALALLD